MFRGKKNKEDEKRAHNFIESFKALSLAGKEKLRARAGSPNRNDFASSSPHLPVASEPHTPPHNSAAWMPPPPILYPTSGNVVPNHTSLTMQHAIAGSLPSGAPATPPKRVVPQQRPVAGCSITPPARPYADAPVLRPGSGPLSPPRPPPASRVGQPTTPQPPKVQAPPILRRAQSEPPSPVASNSAASVGGTRQCNGVTAAGKQCRNQVKVSDAQALAGGDVFCRVHGNKVGEVSGFYDRKTGQTFVKFEGECDVLHTSFSLYSPYVRSYVLCMPVLMKEYHTQTGSPSIYRRRRKTRSAWRCRRPVRQATSRVIYMPSRSLVRAPSFASSPLFHLICVNLSRADPTDKKTIHLKVGRATNLNRRMDQWSKQCGSKEQILRGFWPGGMDKGGVPMKGLVQAGPKGPWCHRVERLVHIELTDLVERTPYLEDGYPNLSASKEVGKKGGKKDVKRCPDCMCSSLAL